MSKALITALDNLDRLAKKYPEHHKAADDVVQITVAAINVLAPLISEKMPYSKQMVLELVIEKLKERV